MTYFSDYIVTWYNVSSGLAAEGNPVVAVLLSDPIWFWLVAFMVSFLTAFLVYVCFRLRKAYGWIAALLVIAVKGFVVVWNFLFILGRVI